MEYPVQELKICHGPSLNVPHKAVIACYSPQAFANGFSVSASELNKLYTILPDSLVEQINSHEPEEINGMLSALIGTFLDLKGPLKLKVEARLGADKKWYLAVEYLNETPAIIATKLAFSIVSYIKSNHDKPPPELINQINLSKKNLGMFLPGELVQKMMFAAKKHNIPYVVMDLAASFISYGQGAKSVFFSHGATQADSHIGYKLQFDKIKANAYLNIIGFPTTTQRTAPTLESCMDKVVELGFPVVIKPPDSGQGRGVTANIKDMDHVKYAFDFALKYTNDGVLVEKFVEGKDYRLTVADNVLNSITCREPAFILGDGINTIEGLIAEENKKRLSELETEATTKGIKIDDTLIQFIDDFGLNLQNIPDDGEKIILRANSNLSTGGVRTFIEENEAHPDNIQMTIDVAKAFRLDSIGIDFISPDLSRSWREVGTIIEINAFPMQSHRSAEKLLKNKFEPNNMGRIESTLIVTNDNDFSREIVEKSIKNNLNSGLSDCEFTSINDNEKALSGKTLFQRTLALLIDLDCDTIILSMTPEQIVSDGLPLDHFDHCVIDKKSTFESQHIENKVKNISDHKCLEGWIKGYVNHLQLR